MKDEKFMIAGKALKLMFIGQLIAIFSFIPGIGTLIGLVGAITALVGLIKIRNADPSYKKAFLMMMLSIGFSIVMSVVTAMAVGSAVAGSEGATAISLVLALVLNLAISAFGFLQLYFVCKATSGLLRELGEDATAARGDVIWKLNAFAYGLMVVILFVSMVSADLGNLLTSVGTIVNIMVGILYIIFLYKSETAFLA